jgi:hypothetical protein
VFTYEVIKITHCDVGKWVVSLNDDTDRRGFETVLELARFIQDWARKQHESDVFGVEI